MRKYILSVLAVLLSLSICATSYAHDYAMTYLFGGTSTQYEAYVQRTGGVLNTVCPDYFEINPNGSLKIQKIDKNFISSMKSKGITVTPFLTNNWDRNLGITALNNTDALASQIATAVYNNNLDGVNVDIENVTELQRTAYTNFVKALRSKMPDKIISVAVAANPSNWQTGWHGSYDYTNLAVYSDYLMIMAYDESFYGGPAGPVASKTFVEKSILYGLSKTSKNKLVLGMPFFGRYWKQGSSVGGSGITSMDVENLLTNYGGTKKYFSDTQSAQVMVTLKDGDVMPKIWGGAVLTPGTYEIWYGDLNSINTYLSLVEQYDLRGSGSWAMGQENPEVWPAYANYKAIRVTGVTLSPTSVSLSVGKTKQLTATVKPSNAADKSVKWTSSKKAVATVSSKGLVKGVGKGTATITVTTNDGAKKATCKVTVTVAVTGVKIGTILPRGKTIRLKATVSPSNASNKGVTWKSSNKKVATVSSKGLVKGLKRGTVTITVKTKSGGKIATHKITVQ